MPQPVRADSSTPFELRAPGLNDATHAQARPGSDEASLAALECPPLSLLTAASVPCAPAPWANAGGTALSPNRAAPSLQQRASHARSDSTAPAALSGLCSPPPPPRFDHRPSAAASAPQPWNSPTAAVPALMGSSSACSRSQCQSQSHLAPGRCMRLACGHEFVRPVLEHHVKQCLQVGTYPVPCPHPGCR
ncbi:hypothetical protein HYH03_007197 [Edaphochlamys debaryana]|uniref:Uncharacterized protein n=1 Tax=Edaphochlamys debaryana TaxID=47281 RepID=A0A836BZD6_9CHLO|nr:hypothetical protein HYH03_007197 [Edaphochlamys debaryana]|eukprot:KAG2494681.1 hypothetical protein HYH03_007197 [Edaphochlamys debaryana]